MDRQSFICNKYLKESSSGICGADDCECDETRLAKEKQVLKETRWFGFAALSVMALLCTILFAGYKINAAKIKVDQWLLAKKRNVLSCSSYGSFNRSQLIDQNNSDKKSSDHGSINNKDPADKNNGNGCTHQQGASSLCETTNSKRRVSKIHTC